MQLRRGLESLGHEFLKEFQITPFRKDGASHRRPELESAVALEAQMAVYLAITGAVAILAAYFGTRSLGLIFGSLRKLATSSRFARLAPPEQMQAFFFTPIVQPSFKRFTACLFICSSVVMILLSIVPPATGTGTRLDGGPFLVMSGLLAAMGIGLAFSGRLGAVVGAFGWCAACGCEMQITGLGQLGGVFMDREEILFGAGVAEHCRECGRLYCSSCYPRSLLILPLRRRNQDWYYKQ